MRSRNVRPELLINLLNVVIMVSAEQAVYVCGVCVHVCMYVCVFCVRACVVHVCVRIYVCARALTRTAHECGVWSVKLSPGTHTSGTV